MFEKLTRSEIRKQLTALFMKENYFVCAQGRHVYVCYPDKGTPITATEVTEMTPKHIIGFVTITAMPKGVVELYILQ